MLKILSRDIVEGYRRDGFLYPIRVISELESTNLRQSLESISDQDLKKIGGRLQHKPHLLITALNSLVRNSKILDVVEDLIGPNILCWGGAFFTKNAGDSSFVSWHQDSTYWGLSGGSVLTAWVALSPATIESGAMKVIRGSHLGPDFKHIETYDQHNLLSRGQEAQGEFNSEYEVDMTLNPGEVSFHDVKLLHCSLPNRSRVNRMGYAIRYITTDVKSSFLHDSALLVRGEDEFRNFIQEEDPEKDFSHSSIKSYLRASKLHEELLHRR
tara:strand:- start:88937 stop:89746 length:810 start_codon:yes stop_codon:yes gene_type:complete